jgi:PmbA protein
MSDTQKAWAHGALQAARSLGAQECQVETGHRISGKLSVEAGEWQSLVRDEQLDCTVIVHHNGRRAKVVDTGTGDPGEPVSRALDAARFNPVDEHLCLADPGACVTLDGLFDPTLAGLDAQGMAELVECLLDTAGNPRVVGKKVSLSTEVESGLILNSRGVERIQSTTLIQCSLVATGKDGQRMTGSDFAYRVARSLDGFRHAMIGEVQELTRRILAGFDPVKGPTGRQALVLSPSLVYQLLVAVPEYHAHGNAIADGFSRLAESLGQAVASPLFSLGDAVHDTSLAGASAHDEEGSATHPLALITDGVLTAHLDSCRSAHRRGTRSTGHARGLHAPVVAGGTLSPAELGTRAGEYLLALDFSGHVDYFSGDFSGVLKNSRWCNPARGIDEPLIETMISGNVFELLHRIVALGRQEDLYGCYRMPWMLVEGVEVSAG